MDNQTKVVDELVSLSSGRTLEAKLQDMVSCLDYGATIGGTAAANTVAINAAIQASASFVLIPYGVAYTEASIVFKDSVTVFTFSLYGSLIILTADYGSSPIAKGGLVIKPQGQNGLLLRCVDFGVTAEPFLQIIDYTTGDIAGTHAKIIELDEISAPANPSANKSRIYTRDNGAGKTQLVVQFPTGAVQVLATEP